MCEICKVEDVLYKAKEYIIIYDENNNEIDLKISIMVCPMCKKLDNETIDWNNV